MGSPHIHNCVIIKNEEDARGIVMERVRVWDNCWEGCGHDDCRDPVPIAKLAVRYLDGAKEQ